MNHSQFSHMLNIDTSKHTRFRCAILQRHTLPIFVRVKGFFTIINQTGPASCEVTQQESCCIEKEDQCRDDQAQEEGE